MGITPEQARKLCQQAGAPLPPGMHAGNFEYVRGTKRKMVGDLSFRSTLEANTYILLKSWQDSYKIRNLVCQPKFVVQEGFRANDGTKIRPITYSPDFSCWRWETDKLGVFVDRQYVIEAKGFRTVPYRLRAKMFQQRYPDIVFQEWTRETLKANGG